MTELKELLKPPFVYRHCDIDNGRISIKIIITHNPEDEINFDKVNNFISDSINEKWERDYGEKLMDESLDDYANRVAGEIVDALKEPKRWIKSEAPGYKYHCPVCRNLETIARPYCYQCGTRLDPPEDKNDNTN